MSDLTIRDVRAIITQPPGARTLVIVKVETNEPEIYGLGCASFFSRVTVVARAVDDYLKPFLVGKDPAEIEDIWQSCNVSAYWRNGPVLNNAVSGVDEALWDIKGKVAGMPIYDLLGGKSREAAAVYVIPRGSERAEYEEDIHGLLEQGFHHLKLGSWHPERPEGEGPAVVTTKLANDSAVNVFEPGPDARDVVNAFEHFRATFGVNPEILYDVHERLPPIQGIALAKDVEQYKPFFLEDVLAPEDNDYHRLIREQTCTPLAMGELYSNPQEMVPMIKDRLFDFIRCHVSTIGGITPARKLAALCEAFNVRTAWHGSADVSPVGHACNFMLDMNVWNFGIQEASCYRDTHETLKEVFPGVPEVCNGYMWPSGKPGHGVDLDEELAARFPPTNIGKPILWGDARRADGTVIRP